ncbi:hypothetical protein OIU79_006603 [Salix purpurea]|uniref:Uncharacterized protein n=1 Tax=Salix purpurea TaxID=77065 RepID=A0A9Q0Z2C2_SALPP|nr:hypothetical protein OIU79_006603 [Salix purpurea]
MNHCAIQQNAFSTREEIRSSVSVPVSDRRDPVVCPKPRRLGLLNNHPARSIRFQLRLKKSGPGPIATAKISTVKEFIADVFGPSINLAASSPPPFFCGSPPSRVANPLIQDARFGDEKFSPPSPVTPIPPTMGLSSSLSPRKGGLVRANFGNKPGVIIEGFDCLDRDRRNCRIPALA